MKVKSTTDTEIHTKEIGMGISKYNKNIVFMNNDALLVSVLNLILMEKGTIPDLPNMGFGLRTRRHFILSGSILNEAIAELNEQIRKYINSPSISSATLSPRKLETGEEMVDVIVTMDTDERIVFSDNGKDVDITSTQSKKDFNK